MHVTAPGGGLEPPVRAHGRRCPGVRASASVSPGAEQPVFVLTVGAVILPGLGAALNVLFGARAHLAGVCFHVRSSPWGHLSGLQPCLGEGRVLRPPASASSWTPRVEEA